MTSKAFGLAQLGNAFADGALSNRNKVINGAMTIDQRNAGAAVTPTASTYVLDRWDTRITQSSKITLQQVSTAGAPVGFAKTLVVTSQSAYSVSTGDSFGIQQTIEGFNIADLFWGTASAKPVTISAWVFSSQGGTFGGSLRNSAGNRSYPFTYTVAANTWTQISITVAGDTSGTWATDNTGGIILHFNLGAGATFTGTAGAWATGNFVTATGATSVVGTLNATFYITGVQLEAGDTATPFEHRSYGAELALCQRYYYLFKNDSGNNVYPLLLQAYGTGEAFGKLIDFPVSMRSTPTVIASGSFSPINSAGNSLPAFTNIVNFAATKQSLSTGAFTGSSGLTAGNATGIIVAPNAQFSISAEL